MEVRNSVVGLVMGILALTRPVGAEPKPDVLIVGAGLAGLSTAYYLQKVGISYHVLEATPHVGGRMRTVRYPGGLAVEAGLKEFWEKNPAIEIAEDLGLTIERVDTTFSSFYHGETLVPFTQDTNEEFLEAWFSPEELAAYRGWDARMAGHLAAMHARPIPASLMALKGVSFKDWMKKAGLPRKVLALVKAVVEPESGTHWDRISALDGIQEWEIFSGAGQGAFHIQGGNQRLAEALATRIGPDHVEVGRRVTNIRHSPDGVEVLALDPGSMTYHRYEARYLVTTMPLYRLYEVLFTPPLPDPIQEAIATQTWGSYFVAHVLCAGEARRFWTVEGESILPILTGGALGVLYDGEPDGQGNVLLNLLVTGDEAENYNARTGSFDTVRRWLLEAFEETWPGFSPHIRQMTFHRYHPRAIAAWPAGRSRLDELSERIRQPLGPIHFAGDFTEGSHSDGAVISAKRVAAQILSSRKAGAPGSKSPAPGPVSNDH